MPFNEVLVLLHTWQRGKDCLATLSIPELKSKTETLLLVTILLNDLSAELIKDRKLKKNIIAEIRYYYQSISEGNALTSSSFDSIKYYLRFHSLEISGIRTRSDCFSIP